MINEALYSLLSGDAGVAALVEDRIYPVERDQAAALPAIVLRRITGVRDHAYDGQTGLVDSRFDVDVYASDVAGGLSASETANAAADAARKALAGYRGTIGTTRIGGIFINDERMDFAEAAGGALRLVRVSLDITCWHSEALA